MNEINLTYIITTFNKLPYLKQVVKRLLLHVLQDEEIIITDGGSTDGTKEYLAGLFEEKLISRFISEPDSGEAHGFNKGLLLAKGRIIKFITDDDSFYFPAIQRCKNYMLEHPEADMLISKIGTTLINNPSEIELHDNYHIRTNYLLKKKIFYASCGLPMLIKKDSLAKLGLFNSRVKLIDYEFLLRISTLANTVYYTNPVVVRIENPKSNLLSLSHEQWYSENVRVGFMYGFLNLKELNTYSFSDLAKELQHRVANKFMRTFRSPKNKKENETNSKNKYSGIPVADSPEFDAFLDHLFDDIDRWIQEKNKTGGEFIPASTLY